MKNQIKKIAGSNNGKTARGYRLKPETHELIIMIQKILKSDQDSAIAGACNMYFNELSKMSIRKKRN